MKHIRPIPPEDYLSYPDKEPHPITVSARSTGQKACKNCGALMPHGNHDCVVCGSKGGEKQQKEKQSTDAPTWIESLADPVDVRKGKRIPAVFGLLVAVVLAISGTGVAAKEYFAYQRLISLYTAQGAILYRQDDARLKIALPTIRTPLTIGGYLGESAPVSAEQSSGGRFLAYMNNQRQDTSTERWLGDLYLLDLILLDGTSEKEGRLLFGDVVDMRFSSRRDYLACVTADGNLMLCDYSAMKDIVRVDPPISSQLIDTEVKGIAGFDGRHLLYFKGDGVAPHTWIANNEGDSGQGLNLYHTVLGEDGTPPVLVGEGLYAIADSTREYDSIIYTKRTRAMPLPLYDVYHYQQRTGQSTRLAAGVRSLVDADASKGAVLYLSPSEETLTFKDLFEDDMLESDNLIQEPDPVAYGIIDQYGNELTGIDPIELDELYEKFDADYDAYLLKAERDRLRRYIREELRNFTRSNYLSFKLLYTTGGQTSSLSDHIYNWHGDAKWLARGVVEKSYVLFARGDRASMERRLLSGMSEADIKDVLNNPYPVFQVLAQTMPQVLVYGSPGGEMQEIFTESGHRYLTRFAFTAQEDGFYFSSVERQNQIGSLYYVTVGSNMADRVLYVDEDVSGIIGVSNNGLFYQKIIRGAFSSRSICQASRSQTRVIAAQTDSIDDARLVGENSDILLFSREDTAKNNRRLYLYDTQERYISQEVEEFVFISPELMYLIRSDGQGRRILCIYDNGEIITLDTDVEDATYFG